MALDQHDRDLMLAELKRELLPGHQLHHQRLFPLLRGRGRDELLVRTIGPGSRLLVVHLTWRAETDPTWPQAISFTSLAAFAESEAD